jgi:small subunit ribosomal protein S4
MARDLTNKCKLCRRAGEKLFLKGARCVTPKCAMIRKAYPPGMHGSKRARPQSEFGQQLAMKQKMRRIYGVLERQFKKYFREAKGKPGVTGDLLIQKLEMRLDNILYRAGFAANRRQARQLVRHAHFLVNKKPVNIPSREIKPGDVIELKSSKTEKAYHKYQKEFLKSGKETAQIPWLEINSNQMWIKAKAIPAKDEAGVDVDAQMVVEFYSR